MGTWDLMPWDNDEAADWFGDLMVACGVREKWLSGVNASVEDEYETVRAAVALFIMLGRVYVWPIQQYDEDLELAIKQCEGLLKVEEYQEAEGFIPAIEAELAELRSRRKGSPGPTEMERKQTVGKKWWQFWA